MKIKRYIGKSSRDALWKVRKDQGPDAVILSTREVGGQTEIIAAVNFEATLAAMERDSQMAQRIAGARQSLKKPATTRQPLAVAKALSTKQDMSIRKLNLELKNMRDLLEQQSYNILATNYPNSSPQHARFLNTLTRMGFPVVLSKQTLADIKIPLTDKNALAEIRNVLAARLPVAKDDLMANGGVYAFVGPTGVGKTTTIAKLAARFSVRHGRKRVALITADNYRIGAHAQLKLYAKMLDVPIHIVTSQEHLHATLGQLSNKRLVLIDTSGLSHRSPDLGNRLSLLSNSQTRINTYLVLSATSEFRVSDEIARAYQAIRPVGAVLTKIDEAASLGGSLGTLIRYKLPLAFVSNGQQVPEDLMAANALSLMNRAMEMVHAGQHSSAGTGRKKAPGRGVHVA